jgi:hypothetical protein
MLTPRGACKRVSSRSKHNERPPQGSSVPPRSHAGATLARELVEIGAIDAADGRRLREIEAAGRRRRGIRGARITRSARLGAGLRRGGRGARMAWLTRRSVGVRHANARAPRRGRTVRTRGVCRLSPAGGGVERQPNERPSPRHGVSIRSPLRRGYRRRAFSCARAPSHRISRGIAVRSQRRRLGRCAARSVRAALAPADTPAGTLLTGPQRSTQ